MHDVPSPRRGCRRGPGCDSGTIVGMSMRVLLSAYECKPHAGTEAGNGWGWATHLAARGLQVHVLTLPKQQEAVEAEVRSLALSNLSFSYVDAWPEGLKEAHGPHYLAW